jgi:hypothetical protein
MVSDVDVIIDVADLPRTFEVLAAGGYHPPPGFRIDDFDAWATARASTPRLRAMALYLANAEGFEVDVHWQLGGNPPARMTAPAMLERSVGADLAGSPAHVVAPLDAVLLTAHHALRSWFLPRSTVKDLCDVGAWFERAPDAVPLDALASAAAEARLTASLLALVRLLPADPALDALEAAAPQSDRRQAARLVKFFDHQLRRGLNGDLLLLLAAPGTVVRSATARVLRPLGRTVPAPPSRKDWLFPDPPGGVRSAPGRAGRLVLDAATTLGPYRAVLRAHAAYA